MRPSDPTILAKPRRATKALAAALCFALAGAAFADEPSPGDRAPEIQVLIKKLGSPDYGVRESARRRLIKVGDEALPFLEAARKDPDPEVAWRADETFKAIRWKVPEIFRQRFGVILDDYTTLTKAERLQLIKTAAGFPPQDLNQGASFITKVVRFDDAPEVRLAAARLYLTKIPRRPKLDRVMVAALEDGFDEAHWIRLAQAQLLTRIGDEKAALIKARRAHVLDAEDFDTQDLLSRLLVRARAYAEALPMIRRQLAKKPGDVVLQIRLGECQVKCGEREAGFKTLDGILKQPAAGRAVQVFLDLNDAYIRLEEGEKALETCRAGLKVFPFNHPLNVALAEAELAKGEERQALRRFLSELRYTQPGSPQADRLQAGLATLFKKAGCERYAGDEEFLADVIRGRPVAKARDRLARWLSDRGLHARAAQELKLVSVLWGRSTEVELRLAEAYRKTGRVEEARAVYQRVLEAEPKNREARSGLEGLEEAPTKAAPDRVARLPYWERNFSLDETAAPVPRVPGPFDAPPLITKRAIVLARPGLSALTALEPSSGKPMWSIALTAPEAEVEGELGLEVLGLIEAPAALVVRQDPERALSGEPVIALVLGVWDRDKNDERWARARFRGLRARVYEPASGRRLADFVIEGALPPSGPLLFRRARAVYRSQRSEKRHSLCLLDLAAGKLRRSIKIKGRRFERLRRRGEALYLAYSGGRYLVDRNSLELRPIPALPKDCLGVFGDGSLAAITRSGALYELGDGEPRRVCDKIEARFGAGLHVQERTLFAAGRLGGLAAFSLKDGGRLWSVQLDRAAERRFWVGEGTLFVANGVGDQFPGEVSYLIGLRASDGQVAWKRPIEVPVQGALGPGRAVFVTGQRRDDAKVIAIDLSGDLAKGRSEATELRSAALDAYQAGEYELSNLLFRDYRRSLASSEAEASKEDRFWFARALAKSKRFLKAENIVSELEMEAGVDQARFFQNFRKEIGLPVEEMSEETEAPAKEGGGQQKPEREKPAEEPKKPAEDSGAKKGESGDGR